MVRESETRAKTAEKLKKKHPDITEQELRRMTEQKLNKSKNGIMYGLFVFALIAFIRFFMIFREQDNTFTTELLAPLLCGLFCLLLGVAGLLAVRRASRKKRELRPLGLDVLHRQLWKGPLIHVCEGLLLYYLALIGINAYAPIQNPAALIVLLAVPIPIFAFYLIRQLNTRKQIVSGAVSIFRSTVNDKGYADVGAERSHYKYYLFFPDFGEVEVPSSSYRDVSLGEDCWLVVLPKKKKNKTKVRAVFGASGWQLSEELYPLLRQR